MPKGPGGERPPADSMGGAVMAAKIEEKRDDGLSSAAAEMGRRGGKKRAENMTPERRVEIARKAAAIRWGGRQE